MTRIILTGASGFIGKHLAPALRKSGHEVFEASSRSGDIAERSTWIKFPKAELVINLAGKTYVPDSWSDPTSFLKCNLLGTIEALNYCKTHNARLIFLSSYLYGNPKSLPILETAALHATNPYALSKKLAEEACQFYYDSFGINVTILRPFNVYGPGQPAFFLIPSIIHQAHGETEIKVQDLEPKRDYIFISDLIDAILKATKPLKGINIFNIGSGKSYSVADVIHIIQKIKQTNLKVFSYTRRRTNEVMDTVADTTHAYKIIGWQPIIDLETGLRITCNAK